MKDGLVAVAGQRGGWKDTRGHERLEAAARPQCVPVAPVPVDAIVDVTSYEEYTSLAERLRALGLAEATTPGAPLCRWRRDAFIADVMPINARVLGFSSRWYPAAIEPARSWRIAGHDVRIVTPALFIAAKLEAFRGRGGGHVFASHDFEDIVTVVDGRSEIVAEGGLCQQCRVTVL
jgi:hypothetical protein